MQTGRLPHLGNCDNITAESHIDVMKIKEMITN